MILPQPAAKHQTERYIYQKRVQDHNNEKLSTKLKQEFYEKEFASWENKGRIVQKNKYINQRLAELRDEAKSQLNQRREKLAYMLACEFTQYQKEIEDMQETPEQVKQKMKERVQHLKEEKEKERREFAEQQLERRFRQNADELRLVNKEYNELKALAERNIQIMEKQELMEEKYQQEMIYAELYRRDYERKKKIEEEKIRIAKEKENERNKILALQKELLEKKKLEAKEEDALEKEMLKEAWKVEEQRNQEKIAVQKKSLQELNQQIHQINEEQKRKKAEYKAQERKDDIEMVRGIVEREKMIAYLEAEQRKLQRKDAQEFMIQAQKTNDQEIYEKELERLVAIENEKQWQKRQEVWDKEQQARIKLMYEVYDQRAEVVGEKKKIRSYEEQEKAIEKDILTQAVQQYEIEQERQRVEEWEKNKGHQQQILQQVDERKQKTAENFNAKKQQEYEDKQRQEQYDQHVAQEKEKARQLLGQLRKQTGLK